MSSLRGSWPMATKSPVTGSSRVPPVLVSVSVTPVTFWSPWMAVTALFRRTDLVVGEGPLDHDLGGPQLVASVHDRHGAGELGEEGGLLHGRVAASDDRDVLVAEEEAVARGAPAHAVTGEALLVGQTQLAVGRAHREDHGVGRVGVASESVTVLTGPVRSTALTVVRDQLGAEALGLGAHVLHELGAHDPVTETGEFSTSVVFISAPPAVTAPSNTSGLRLARAA